VVQYPLKISVSLSSHVETRLDTLQASKGTPYNEFSPTTRQDVQAAPKESPDADCLERQVELQTLRSVNSASLLERRYQSFYLWCKSGFVNSGQCNKSKTLESCQRCQRLRKLCSPRQKKASPNALSGTFESNATQVLTSERVVSRLRKRNYWDTFDSPPSPLGIAEALLHLDGSVEYAREFEAQEGDGSSDVENGERTKFLYELMGYDKTQRPEYMRSRRTAREAAHPLSLDKAWRSYTESERDQAVKRVIESYDYRYSSTISER
jgi:hypothetical protein